MHRLIRTGVGGLHDRYIEHFQRVDCSIGIAGRWRFGRMCSSRFGDGYMDLELLADNFWFAA